MRPLPEKIIFVIGIQIMSPKKEDENIEQNYVVSSFNKSDNLSDNSFVNPFTKFDLTIPRVNTIKCINPEERTEK